MNGKSKRSGFTLIELLVWVGLARVMAAPTIQLTAPGAGMTIAKHERTSEGISCQVCFLGP
jgi:Tfp pilus assembly protein FimT